ncbi:MAG TPA: SMC-Scp complex subunit ScpB, partial [Chloroflexota bacterium]|nr:SMC-Scp complex subunit ScpB [Chloroflexota bacterium]
MSIDLVTILESILFVAADPVPAERLLSTLGCADAELSAALDALGEQLQARGIRLQRSAEGFQLVSAPEHATVVERFLGIQATGKLSAAAMETLAIIAYRQPVSRAQIEEVRGVNSDRAIHSLLGQGLIQEV